MVPPELISMAFGSLSGFVFKFMAQRAKEKAEMLKTRTVEKILEEGLIGGHLDSRKGTAWGLVSAMTQYTSHNRTKAADQTDERTFASQLDGSRNYMNKNLFS